MSIPTIQTSSRQTHSPFSSQRSYLNSEEDALMERTRARTESIYEPPIDTTFFQNPYTSCFMPKDPKIKSIDQYQIACEHITKIVKNPIALHTHIVELNTLTHTQENLGNFSLKVLAAITSELKEKKLSLSIDSCNSKLHTIALNKFIQDTLNINRKVSYKFVASLDFDKFTKRIATIKTLSGILLPYLNYKTIATIKVDADFICIFPRLTEKVSKDHSLILEDISTFPNLQEVDTDYVSPFPYLSAQINSWLLSLDSLPEVVDLDLSHTHIETFPSQVSTLLTHIKKLEFRNNDCSSLPLLASFAELSSLEDLDLSYNQFTTLTPSFFDNLPRLQRLDLRHNAFSKPKKNLIQNLCASRNIQLFI